MYGMGFASPEMDYYRANTDGEGEALKMKTRDQMRRQEQ